MSLEVTLQRMVQIQGMLSPPPPAATPAVAAAPSAFGQALQTATGQPAGMTSLLPSGGTNGGRAALAAAQGEVGVAEQPPGSNDSPRIAQYRQATAGSGVGPWCAYFVSWAARQAGTPIGDQGQGYGSVDAVWAWGERTGRAMPATGTVPQSGDLIVWDEHIGIVESVGPDGSINTVEGNSSDQVSRRSYAPGERPAIGYVRLG
jgi:CHAP domain